MWHGGLAAQRGRVQRISVSREWDGHDRSVGGWVDRSVSRLVGWSVGWSVGRSVGRSMHMLP